MDLKSIIEEEYGRAGYTVKFHEPESDDYEQVNRFSCYQCSDASEENTQSFEPYIKKYKCAHKDCSNTWTVLITEEILVLMCGGHAKVCSDCKDKGFSVFDGKGDGRFYLSQNDKEIDSYDLCTAYGLLEEDIREIF